MAVGRFQAGHKQGKHNTDHRDQARQLPGFELTGSACMVGQRGEHRMLTIFSLQEFPQPCQSAYSIDAECSVSGTHGSV